MKLHVFNWPAGAKLLKGYICNASYYQNRNNPPFPFLSYFPMVLCLRWLCHHILSSVTYISGETGTLSPFLKYSLWCVQMIGYIMAGGSCSFVCTLHCLIIIIIQTYLKALDFKKLVRSGVCLRLSQSSQLNSFNVLGCVSSAYPILVMIVRMLNLLMCVSLLSSSNRKDEWLTIVRSWYNGTRCMPYFDLMTYAIFLLHKYPHFCLHAVDFLSLDFFVKKIGTTLAKTL